MSDVLVRFYGYKSAIIQNSVIINSPAAVARLATLDDWRSGETVRVMATVATFGREVRL
jgi:hypothetical protein